MSAYKEYRFSDLIEEVEERNISLEYGLDDIVGVTIEKGLIPTIANLTQTALDKFYIVKPDTFVYNPRTHGIRLGMGYNDTNKTFLTSWNNVAFRVKEDAKKIVLSKYLWIYFNRPEWDRQTNFMAWGSSTIVFAWNDFLSIKIQLPDLKEQEKIVNTYNAITKRIQLKQKINENLEKTAQCLFEKMWESDECIEVELSKLADLTSSKRVFFDEYVPEGIPFYRGGEITEKRQGFPISNPLYITEESYNEKIEKYGVPNAGDILITAVGTIGNSYMVTENDKFYFKDGNLIWFRNFQNNSNYIIYDFLNSKQFKNKIEQISIGSTQTALTISGLSKIKIRIPQNTLFAEYLEKSKSIQSSIQDNNAEMESLFVLRNIIVSSISGM